MTFARLVVHHGNEAHATGHHLVAGLRTIGVEVVEVGSGHTATANDVAPDTPLLWIESGRASFPLPSELTGRPTATWLIDTHRGLEWRAPFASAFDHCFVAQIDAVDLVTQFGVPTTWLPLASFDVATEPSVERTREVGFVGFVDPGSRRERILDRVARDFDVYRNDSYVAPRDIPGWYRQVQVVLNVPLERDLNMRVFEAGAAGASVVSGPMNGLDELELHDGITVVDSDDPAEWSRAVGEVLADPDRGAGAARLCEQVAQRHTYVDRAKRVIEMFESCEMRTHSVDHRRAVTTRAAVRRHALRAAWEAAEHPRVRTTVLLPQLAAEAARTIRRRVSAVR